MESSPPHTKNKIVEVGNSMITKGFGRGREGREREDVGQEGRISVWKNHS